jgi:hypothetical protein
MTDWQMSRNERLERWATVLDEKGTATLMPFYEVEFLSNAANAPLRQPNSPLALAYQDPVLRRAGLDSDRYSESGKFFGLSRREAHRILCSCSYFGAMRASEVARRIRVVTRPKQTWRWTPAGAAAALARLLSRCRPVAGLTRPA